MAKSKDELQKFKEVLNENGYCLCQSIYIREHKND
jgi:hypothetical protein